MQPFVYLRPDSVDQALANAHRQLNTEIDRIGD